MNLTIVSAPVIERFGEEKAFEMFKTAGFDGVDYSFDAVEKVERLGENYMDFARDTKRLLEKYSLSCYQAHAPFEFQFENATVESDAKFIGVIRALEYAAVIGAKVIVVHAVRVPFGEDFLNYNLNYYKALEPYAKKFGIKIAVENLVRSTFWSPFNLSQFVEMLDSPVFCACIDVGHAAITGNRPENFIEGMKKGIVKCVHLHDTDFQLDRHWVPFLGQHNWDNIMKALADYGFDGDIEMEVIYSFSHLDDELFLPMLIFCEKAGRLLQEKFNRYKK